MFQSVILIEFLKVVSFRRLKMYTYINIFDSMKQQLKMKWTGSLFRWYEKCVDENWQHSVSTRWKNFTHTFIYIFVPMGIVKIKPIHIYTHTRTHLEWYANKWRTSFFDSKDVITLFYVAHLRWCFGIFANFSEQFRQFPWRCNDTFNHYAFWSHTFTFTPHQILMNEHKTNMAPTICSAFQMWPASFSNKSHHVPQIHIHKNCQNAESGRLATNTGNDRTFASKCFKLIYDQCAWNVRQI